MTLFKTPCSGAGGEGGGIENEFRKSTRFVRRRQSREKSPVGTVHDIVGMPRGGKKKNEPAKGVWRSCSSSRGGRYREAGARTEGRVGRGRPRSGSIQWREGKEKRMSPGITSLRTTLGPQRGKKVTKRIKKKRISRVDPHREEKPKSRGNENLSKKKKE